MSLEIARQVNAEFPHLLQTNIGATCYEFTLKLIERLKADGHEAYSMCKSPGEGQYVPPEFQQRMVTGLDGKEYLCSGVSHDAIWCNGKQFDTIAGANEHDQFIYRKVTEPFWSFDPADGQKIVGLPIWNAIPQQFWRPNNPPLKDDATSPPPPAMPDYEALGGDAYWRAEIGVPLAEDMATAGPDHGGGPLNDGSVVWLSRPIFRILHAYAIGRVPDRPAIIKSVRNEWRAVLTAQGATGLPPLP